MNADKLLMTQEEKRKGAKTQRKLLGLVSEYASREKKHKDTKTQRHKGGRAGARGDMTRGCEVNLLAFLEEKEVFFLFF